MGYIRTYSGIWVMSKYGVIPAGEMRPGLISRGFRVEGKEPDSNQIWEAAEPRAGEGWNERLTCDGWANHVRTRKPSPEWS